MFAKFHFIETDGLPKRNGTYFVIMKNIINGEHVIDALPFSTSVANVVESDPYLDNDNSADHPGFIDEMLDSYGEYAGNIEVTDQVLAWASLDEEEIVAAWQAELLQGGLMAAT